MGTTTIISSIHQPQTTSGDFCSYLGRSFATPHTDEIIYSLVICAHKGVEYVLFVICDIGKSANHTSGAYTSFVGILIENCTEMNS